MTLLVSFFAPHTFRQTPPKMALTWCGTLIRATIPFLMLGMVAIIVAAILASKTAREEGLRIGAAESLAANLDGAKSRLESTADYTDIYFRHKADLLKLVALEIESNHTLERNVSRLYLGRTNPDMSVPPAFGGAPLYVTHFHPSAATYAQLNVLPNAWTMANHAVGPFRATIIANPNSVNQVYWAMPNDLIVWYIVVAFAPTN
jgi:hypothetical protein